MNPMSTFAGPIASPLVKPNGVACVLPIARARTARCAVQELLARHDVRDAGTDERIQSLVDDLASMVRLAATGRLTVADAVDELGMAERTEAVTLAELVRTALPGGGEAPADQRAVAREVVALVFRWLATDAGQQIARVCRTGLAGADYDSHTVKGEG